MLIISIPFFRNLRALDIRGCWRITDKGMSLVAEYCPQLVVLYVTDCRDITEKSLNRLRMRGVKIDRPLNPFYGMSLVAAGNISDNNNDSKPNNGGPPPPQIRLQV